MPRILPSVIEEIRQLNIADVISPAVNLIRKGRSIMGLCPFHNEKTPSFHVHEDKGFFKCFGCNEAGDAITFVMKHRNLDYVDAVTYICENFGIELKYDKADAPQQNIKDLKNLHEAFANHAQKTLFLPEGAQALKYLEGRGFSQDIIKKFGLGYVPQNFSAALFEKSFKDDVLTASGIYFKTKYGLRSFFSGRILFPIRSATGSCVGFSGRTMDPEEKAKYKNSPETPIFSKRRELFNFHNAKDTMREDKSCHIVEGYFDVMRMVAAGYGNTVAIMGTAFTKEQVTQLKKYVEEYNLLLDGDEAGVKAMRDSRSIALEMNVYPNVIFLPPDDDPDTFIKNNGRYEFDDLLKTKEDLFIYTIKSAFDKGTDANRRFHRLEEIKKMLEEIKDPYRREYYAKITAQTFGVAEDILSADIRIERAKAITVDRVKKKNGVNFVCERDFVSLLFHLAEDTVDKLIQDMTPDYFEDEAMQKVFKKILELSGQSANIRDLINDSDVGEAVAALFIQSFNTLDLYSEAVENKNQIISNFSEKNIRVLKSQLSSSHDEDEKDRLLISIQNQLKTLNQLKKRNY